MGKKFYARPTPQQSLILSSWMGGAKFIWNAKCQEDRYLRKFGLKYLPIGSFPPIDQSYSQYKCRELSPFLYDIPSQILRNSASNWYRSYQAFFNKQVQGRPRIKKRGLGMSVHLTRELFSIEDTAEGLKLFIGSKRNNIGYLDVNWHDKSWLKYGMPASLRIKKSPSGRFTVSFCYDDQTPTKDVKEDRELFFNNIKESYTEQDLENSILAVDRGVDVAIATNLELRPFNEKAATSLRNLSKKQKKLQRSLSRKKTPRKKSPKKKGKSKNKILKNTKDSNRYKKQRIRLAKSREKSRNIRENECHHISKELSTGSHKIVILEDLKIKNMTRSARGSKERPGRNVAAKSGLNREILNIGWGLIEVQLRYKALRNNKVIFKINPAYTSQECANCGHTHTQNRKGKQFHCGVCNNQDHADLNAAKVIKKRAVNLLLHSGTELSDKGVLVPPKDIGRGASVSPSIGIPICGISERTLCKSKETSKKMDQEVMSAN